MAKTKQAVKIEVIENFHGEALTVKYAAEKTWAPRRHYSHGDLSSRPSVVVPRDYYELLDEAWGELAGLLDGGGKLDDSVARCRNLLARLDSVRDTFFLGDDGDPDR